MMLLAVAGFEQNNIQLKNKFGFSTKTHIGCAWHKDRR
jgi:hypothetical protein